MSDSTPEPATLPSPAYAKATSLRWLVYAALFMLIGMMTLIYIGRDRSTIVNAPMPELDLVPISQATDTPTNKLLNGRVVVYHFWGTWCPPCMAEYPEFYEVYQHFQANPKVKFVSVSCESGTPINLETLKQETESFLTKIEAPMPVYADPAIFTRAQIARMLSAGGFEYPSTLLVDQNGTVRYMWRGYAPGGMEELEEKIDSLLKNPPAQL